MIYFAHLKSLRASYSFPRNPWGKILGSQNVQTILSEFYSLLLQTLQMYFNRQAPGLFQLVSSLQKDVTVFGGTVQIRQDLRFTKIRRRLKRRPKEQEFLDCLEVDSSPTTKTSPDISRSRSLTAVPGVLVLFLRNSNSFLLEWKWTRIPRRIHDLRTWNIEVKHPDFLYQFPYHLRSENYKDISTNRYFSVTIEMTRTTSLRWEHGIRSADILQNSVQILLVSADLVDLFYYFVGNVRFL